MLKTVAIAAAGFLSVAQAQAAPILVNQWYTFGFGGVGSALISGNGFAIGTNPVSLPAPVTPWTFTLGAGGGTLVVTDGFDSGDQFRFFNSGVAIGDTSVPVSGFDCGNNITACLASANFSEGNFALAAGNYSLTGQALASPFGAGAGFFIVRSGVVGAVPEPSTWAIMLLGFGVVGTALRRHKARHVTTRVSFV